MSLAMSKTEIVFDDHPSPNLPSIACTTPTADSPIGVFDSGVGGLSVYLHLKRHLPHERYLYYADTKHVPYGSRTAEDISRLTLTAIDWLIGQGCKLVVVACNSASAHALNQARLRYPSIAIVGLVPALKPALAYVQAKQAKKAKQSKATQAFTNTSGNTSNNISQNARKDASNHVVVLATLATLNGQLLDDVITQFAIPHGISVSKCYEPALVPWVEAGMPPTDTTAERLRELLTQFADNGVQAIVLGCTHYPFFREFLLTEIAKQRHDMALFDSGDAIARRVGQVLGEQGLLSLPSISPNSSPNSSPSNDRAALSQSTNSQAMNSQSNVNTLAFFATANSQGLSELVTKLCGDRVTVDEIKDDATRNNAKNNARHNVRDNIRDDVRIAGVSKD